MTQQNRSRGPIWVNGQRVETDSYRDYHRRRIQITLDKLGSMGARRILELGAHPWVMTAAILEDSRFQVAATISAEEITRWPDEIPLQKRTYQLRTAEGQAHRFPNYSVNVERTLFDLDEDPDTVLACEIVEHLIRAPHFLFLNANRWLPEGGKLLVTTPNGAQFMNPFRRRTPTAAYRSHVYERHSFLFTREGLADLIQLCGFRITESGYWNVYPYQGLSRLYRPLTRIPWGYFQDKFQKTIVVVAEKEKAIHRLERIPSVYHSANDWEAITTQLSHDHGEVGD